MAEQIIDGKGTGSRAEVDSNNRLQTFAISEGLSLDAAKNGENYNINTGSITLTSATESAVMYLKNNEDKNFVIEEVIIILGASTGGTGDLTIELIRNPTTGTVISGATDADVVGNRNFGSSRELVADVYKGAEGNTLTDGTLFSDTTRSAASTVVRFDADVIVMPKGTTIGVNITPQASNTSMSVKVAIVGYLF
jgi:hypothetical protein